MRRILAALIGALSIVRVASAQPPPSAPPPPPARATPPKDAGPDLAFLEYLGSWQGDDDEWLAIKEWDQDNAPKGAPGEHKEPAADPPRNERHDESK